MADNFNIAAGFHRSAGEHAERLFYSDGAHNVTYGEMGATVARLADHLTRSGRPRRIAGARFITQAAPVQTTWPVESEAIDHTFSELMFIPSLSNGPAFGLPRRRSSSAFPSPFGLVDASIAAVPSTSLVLSLAETLPI